MHTYIRTYVPVGVMYVNVCHLCMGGEFWVWVWVSVGVMSVGLSELVHFYLLQLCDDVERNDLHTYLYLSPYFVHLSGAALAALTVSDLLLIHLHGVCTDTDHPSMLPLLKL